MSTNCFLLAIKKQRPLDSKRMSDNVLIIICQIEYIKKKGEKRELGTFKEKTAPELFSIARQLQKHAAYTDLNRYILEQDNIDP